MTAARPSARTTILQLLKQSKGLTAIELASALGISPVAVRKHLSTLQQDDLVAVALRRTPVGRPSYVYRLTPSAAAQFPQGYRQMLLDLLSEVESTEGAHKVKRLLEGRAARQRRHYEQRLLDQVGNERVRLLARLRNEDGFMTALEEDETGFIMRQFNCPIQDVSHHFRQTCGCEIDLMRDLIGTTQIERTETLVNGDSACTYHIPKTKQDKRS